MSVSTSYAGRVPRSRIALLAVLIVTLFAAVAAEAGATVRVETHTDPAGDPTLFSYSLSGPTISEPRTAQIADGDYRGWGVPPGIYTMQASPPAGWRVAAIQCTDQAQSTAAFAIDVANARVTVDHRSAAADPANTHHVCAFTLQRAGGSGVAGTRQTGIAPTPLITGQTNTQRPARSALARVRSGRRSALGTVRLARRAVVRATLLNGNRVVGSKRVVRNAGEHRVRVNIKRSELRRLRAGGKKRATLRLRVVIAERSGSTRVFSLRVRVRLT
jgi:hypothetical protein